jgi:hypothetical protein
MSAYEVTDTHINALVSAALFAPRGALSWYWDRQNGGPVQSRRIDCENAGDVATMLRRENAISVAYRYRGGAAAVVRDHHLRYLPKPYSPVAVLKAVQGYAYQACEHPGWRDSEAFAFCEYLTTEYIMQLPGYEDAAWAVESDREMTTGIRNHLAMQA